ncbi:hypothetical protein I309_03427 [Cryptococcus deuterogattii LA55]|nr:hypothetical protein I309_03427 [Cryptococcus deuterogattii LA55]KIR73034.1 hypothetical protein I310_02693 [Cryptococcus deuterogattii CA1014]KIR90189.1 hypothetical protein I304_06126 [Cryptococcus deuterogattii CBS 10090]
MSNFQSLKSTRTARQKSSVQNNAGRLVHEVTVGPDKNASKNSDGQAVEQISSSGENKCVKGEKDDKALEGEIRKSGSMSTIALMAPTTSAETIPVEQLLGIKSQLMKLYEKELDGVGIEIKDIPGRGRGLVSTKSFKSGSVIIRLPLAVSVLGTSHLTTTCHGCFLTPSEKEILLASGNLSSKTVRVKLSRCSGYWSIHKQECTAFSRLRTMYHKAYPDRVKDEGDARWAGPEGVRVAGRLCWQRRAKIQARKGKEDGDGWWDKLSLMESQKDVMKLASQVQHLEHYLSAAKDLSPGEDPAVLHPSYMGDYGFDGVGDVLNLCSAPMEGSRGLIQGVENETGKVQVRCIACKEEFEVDADRLRKLIREGLSFLESDERGTLAYSGSCLSLPQNHPIQAVILAEWSKLLALDRVHNPEEEGQRGEDELMKRLEMAIIVGRRAVMSAQKGWGGDGGVVGVEMEGLVRGCEGELGLLRARRMDGV